VATIVTPETILRWYQRLIAEKWTFEYRRPGRPGLMKEIAALIVRMATADPIFRYVQGHRTADTGIGVVYDWFVAQLAGSPYEAFAQNVYDRWRERLADGSYPKFTAV
jgi:hypothetical protein